MRLLDFCRTFVLGGVGHTERVLFALVNGLFSRRGLVALLVAEEAGKEKAMFKHEFSLSVLVVGCSWKERERV